MFLDLVHIYELDGKSPAHMWKLFLWVISWRSALDVFMQLIIKKLWACAASLAADIYPTPNRIGDLRKVLQECVEECQ